AVAQCGPWAGRRVFYPLTWDVGEVPKKPQQLWLHPATVGRSNHCQFFNTVSRSQSIGSWASLYYIIKRYGCRHAAVHLVTGRWCCAVQLEGESCWAGGPGKQWGASAGCSRPPPQTHWLLPAPGPLSLGLLWGGVGVPGKRSDQWHSPERKCKEGSLSLSLSVLIHPRGPLPDEKQSAAELDAVLQHHHSIQEKLAEEMLHLARNLKNNTLVAQNVIKQDNQTLSHSLKLADHNFEKLKDESDRLEQHAKKSVNWFLWLMLIVVCFIFISMILFIRIFPKLR
uniref:Vesicle transport protein USE1 n=1 Tax=Podarcis muralis TaxID=64176 RepID=A0A670KAI8_PODMU